MENLHEKFFEGEKNAFKPVKLNEDNEIKVVGNPNSHAV